MAMATSPTMAMATSRTMAMAIGHTIAMASTGPTTGRTMDTTGPITGRIAMGTTIGPTIGMATEGTGDISDLGRRQNAQITQSLTSAVTATALVKRGWYQAGQRDRCSGALNSP